MIVVTGSPRSGTSLMMQTLRLLGIDIFGEEYNPAWGPKKHFPGGGWDIPIGFDVAELKDKKYEKMAVKLFPGNLLKVDPSLINKLIICVREKSDCVDSIFKVLVDTPDTRGVEKTRDSAEKLYKICNNLIAEYLKQSWLKYHIVKFDDMIKNGEGEIGLLKCFLNISKDSKEAVENIIKKEG